MGFDQKDDESKEKIDDLKYQFDIIKKENMKKYEA